MSFTSRWSSKVALVTGATTGIGQAIAVSLARVGLNVALAGRRENQLENVAAEIRSGGGSAVAIQTDISDEESILRCFETVKREFGGLDVLVNSAGVGYESLMATASTEDWRQVLDVNVLGTSICIREALHLLQNRCDTAIITISSLAAYRIPPGGYAYYAASKHALRAIMEGLRAELVTIRSPTKVGSISPGTVATEFHKLFSRTDKDPTEAIGFERLLPNDIAEAVLYMLSTPPHVQINDIMMRPIGQPG